LFVAVNVKTKQNPHIPDNISQRDSEQSHQSMATLEAEKVKFITILGLDFTNSIIFGQQYLEYKQWV
jgi:hypothetical protein